MRKLLVAFVISALLPTAASASSFCTNNPYGGKAGKAMYLPGGKYVYVYPSGRRVIGRWTGNPNSSVTVTFKNGVVRHDTFEKSGGVMYLRNGSGRSYAGAAC